MIKSGIRKGSGDEKTESERSTLAERFALFASPVSETEFLS
jgi:hypothetical protein